MTPTLPAPPPSDSANFGRTGARRLQAVKQRVRGINTGTVNEKRTFAAGSLLMCFRSRRRRCLPGSRVRLDDDAAAPLLRRPSPICWKQTEKRVFSDAEKRRFGGLVTKSARRRVNTRQGVHLKLHAIRILIIRGAFVAPVVVQQKSCPLFPGRHRAGSRFRNSSNLNYHCLYHGVYVGATVARAGAPEEVLTVEVVTTL